MSKKKLTALSSFLLCICLLSGCGRAGEAITTEPPEPAITAEPVEIKDTQDNQAPAVDDVSDPISGEPSGPLEADSERTEVSLFDEANETVYATGTVNIRASYRADSEKLGSLGKGTSITRTGIGTGEAEGWSRVQLSDGTTAYISSQYLSTTKPVVQSSSGGSTQQTPAQTTPSQPSGQTSGSSSSSGGGSLEDVLKQQAEMNQGGIGFTDREELTEEGRQALADMLNGSSQQQGTPSSSDSSSSEPGVSTTLPSWGEHITDPAEIASGNENPYDTIYHPIP